MIILIAVMALMGSTLTLPGIAGIVLSIGMAVDANVIIFTRIREELSAGGAIRPSCENGFKNSKYDNRLADYDVYSCCGALSIRNKSCKGICMDSNDRYCCKYTYRRNTYKIVYDGTLTQQYFCGQEILRSKEG